MAKPIELILMKAYKPEMIAYVKSHPASFKELVLLSVEDEKYLSWRAAWVISEVMEENDKRLHGVVDKILGVLSRKKDGHQRELLKVLCKMKLNEDQEALLFDICLNIWQQIHKRPSVRHTAFKYIMQLAQKYPDLQNELNFLTQEHYLETLSPGIKKVVCRDTEIFLNKKKE